MSDLDDKLIKILDESGLVLNSTFEHIAHLVAKLKQAFADELLAQTNDADVKAAYTKAFTDAGYLTGQEWYDRWINQVEAINVKADAKIAEFKKHLRPEDAKSAYVAWMGAALNEAAKKAAGIE